MSIACEEVERCIPFLLDDELEGDGALEVEGHLGTCASCRAALEREGRLRLALRRATHSVAASAALRRRVRESIESERRSQSAWLRPWPAVAAAAVLAAFIWKGATAGASGEFEAIAEGHARDVPMDVVAADVGQVQDYFNRRLPFSVRLPNIVGASVSSMGGRITHVRDHDAAYVRYEMPRGRVSMFVYEDPDDDLSEVAPLYQIGNRRVLLKQVHGYTVAKWRSAGLTYSMVTNLPEHEVSTALLQNMR